MLKTMMSSQHTKMHIEKKTTTLLCMYKNTKVNRNREDCYF